MSSSVRKDVSGAEAAVRRVERAWQGQGIGGPVRVGSALHITFPALAMAQARLGFL